jgi:hypothetical protein
VLNWLREHGCPLGGADLCAAAADGGYLEVLKWARERNCPWDAETRRRAADGGHLEVLRWLDEQGAP